MGTENGNKQLKSPIIPPSELLVQKFTESRAPEFESLYTTISSRLNNNFKSQRNKRRRTTGYDNRGSKTRFRKKQKVGVSIQNNDENSDKNVKKGPPRHIRRRKELYKNPESGFCNSGDGTKRLRTHVWFAKRFTMIKRWGFYLPLGLHGRGKGSRALLKWLNNGTVVHDASYYSAIQLEGSQDSLLSILSTVMSPFPSSDYENILSGSIYATSLLHHGRTTNLHIIAPVIYMFRPNQQSTNADSESVDQINGVRQLWIWLHAAALTEGYNALKSACESQGKTNENVTSVSCTSLEGQFGTLELTGSKSSQLLQKILHPITTMKNGSLIGALEDHIPCSGIISLTVNDPRGLTNIDFDSNNTDLWEAGKEVCGPVEESVICMEKHNQRLSSFCLTDKSTHDINGPNKMCSSRFCPVLLLRKNDLKDSITRWSIILPLSWVKAFWVPLISNGARATGLRERSWVACEAGIPIFPSEFPECDSYSSLMEAEISTIDKESSLRPASVKPFQIPILPPWDCVHLAFKTGPIEPETTHISPNKSDTVTELTSANHNMIVARSSRTLADFLNSIDAGCLPLFSHFLGEKICVSKIIKDENLLNGGPNSVSFLENGFRKVCFVRVILRAYKEGVIEDGAVVCAPCLDDIKLWTSGSNNKGELKVPQSFISSYFVKRDSGKWEFQLPQDPAAIESNRWPIGFVTTGFVPGSKKPLASALCDVVLLTHLRQEQWSSVPLKQRKREIFVLTRNLRSTTFRLALASIVLENQQHDLDYI